MTYFIDFIPIQLYILFLISYLCDDKVLLVVKWEMIEEHLTIQHEEVFWAVVHYLLEDQHTNNQGVRILVAGVGK